MANLETAIPDRILRIIVISAVALAALIALGIFANRLYQKWQPERLAKQARLAIERGDYPSAAVLTQRALNLNSDNAEACRVAAELADKARSPEAIGWWERVTNLSPNSTSDALALARTAIRVGALAKAQQVLEKLKDRGNENPEYHFCAALLAEAQGKYQAANDHYAAALRLQPENALYQYATAKLELRFLEKRDAARATLRALSTHKAMRLPALRALLADDVAIFDWKSAEPTAKELANDPTSEFNDRLAYLEVLRRSYSPDFPVVLAAFQSTAKDRPDDLAALLLWMERAGRAGEAIEWALTLPKETRSHPTVSAALGLCLISKQDWVALEALVRGAKWDALEFARLAFLARALRERGEQTLFRSTWSSAVAAASKQPGALIRLHDMVAPWRWKSELLEIYWALAEDPSTQMLALQKLYRQYQSDGNAAGLKRVVSRLEQIDPASDILKNNRVIYSLLTGDTNDANLAVSLDLYLKYPTDPAFVSTYAYALYVKGRAPEALAAMNTLRNDQLEDPSTAAYYGILLLANGAPDAARKYLDLAKDAALLTEEKILVEKARSKLK